MLEAKLGIILRIHAPTPKQLAARIERAKSGNNKAGTRQIF